MQHTTGAPHVQLATMSRWYVVSRAIHAIAQLGIANHMTTEPKQIAELAVTTRTDPVQLERLLKFLTPYAIFNEENGGYSLTELSKPLRDDDPHSIRDVLCMVDDSWWQAFSNLDKSLKSGIPAFEHQHGDHFFSFLSKNPEKQYNFDKGMAKLSTYDDDAISSAYNFSEFNTIIDVGGGRGGLIKALVNQAPHCHGILFDSPSVIQQLDKNDFPDNVSLMAGDFFKEIPKGDAYVFKGVLHDFNDDMTQQILINCRKHMPNTASLFIAEQVMPDNDLPHPNKTMDIVMMVLLGGRQRTLSEWQYCVEMNGFKLEKPYPTNSLFTLMKFKLAH